ncbi:MAG: DnaJ C-terminal domain-containing protein [Steroidobacteraceae bacterium]|jgi:curved DNA-binding protein
MKFKDYYAVMGLARDATQDQIKQAYRKLARKYHPDVSKEADAEQRFKDVGEAYAVLQDPEKRAAYDQLGSGPKGGEDFRPPPDWGTGFEFGGGAPDGDAGSDSDFFEALFGQRGRAGARGGRHAAPSDHHARVLVDLEASLQGATRSFGLRVPELDAQGRLVTVERQLNVKIPKGIRAGQQIRLAGQGFSAPGQTGAGDLYLEIAFQPHPLYRVDGSDLYLDLPVAPWEAALGASVPVPTPGGAVQLKIPAGSRGGTTLRLKGRGIPASTPGDLYAVLGIALPAADSEAAKSLYAQMAAALPFNPRASLGV